MRISVFRKAHFNAAHRLHSNELTDLENRELFGKCNRPNFHGHNYELIVRLSGEIDPVTGYLIDLGILKEIIQRTVVQQFDHRNLNLDLPIFKELNPTVENITVVIWNILRAELDDKYALHVRLYETERNYAEYPAAN
jgi:6-pyruvoyltetrahydropterin/6-carboxytetrahydropterin synthase